MNAYKGVESSDSSQIDHGATTYFCSTMHIGTALCLSLLNYFINDFTVSQTFLLISIIILTLKMHLIYLIESLQQVTSIELNFKEIFQFFFISNE